MTTPLRFVAIVVVFLIALIAWEVLGGITNSRTHSEEARLTSGVEELWGEPLTQADPDVFNSWTVEHEVNVNGVLHTESEPRESAPLTPDASELAVDLSLDQRLKGLIWYSLYNVTFDGRWSYTNRAPAGEAMSVFFALPDPRAMYDDFRFELDGKELSQELTIQKRGRGIALAVEPGRTIKLHVHYRTRGKDQFSYVPSNANSLSHFHLRTTTNFDSIDYPRGATSPTDKARSGAGWTLDWTFAQVLSGKPMGMVMPTHIQPGELAADLSFSAPVSLFFFFLILLALSTLRGLDIHPINYLGIAGAFFAFQLLFAYSVDHLPLWLAFTLSSGASIGLVVSYLRLVVDARFALREAAAAQLVYQVGFALAHFWEGYTGLTLSVMATLTLFLVMQLTGRLRWSTLLTRSGSSKASPAGNLVTGT